MLTDLDKQVVRLSSYIAALEHAINQLQEELKQLKKAPEDAVKEE